MIGDANMITEARIKAIELCLEELQQNFLQMQRNQVPVTEKADNNANQIAVLDSSFTELNAKVFPEWNGDGYDYFASERVLFDGQLYRCIQNHTSQSDWTPPHTPALWVRTSTEEYPEWIQPTGAHDAYALGAKVSHNEKHWISDIDNNVYEPGVYGWSEVP